MHRKAGSLAPNGSPLVFRAIAKINRLAVVSGERTGHASPLVINDRYRLNDHWAGSERLQELRNLAFIHVAYSTLMRISELARIRLRDLLRAEDGRFIPDVSHTKIIVHAGGLIKAISAFSCHRLEQWTPQPDLVMSLTLTFSVGFTALIELSYPVPVKNRSIFLQLKILIAKRGRLPNIRKLCWRIRTAIVAGAAHSARAGAAMDMAHKDFWGPAWPPILA